MRIVLRLYSKGKAKKYFGTSLRRMLYWIEHNNFDKGYVKVSYGRFPANDGKIAEFYNDGVYTDKKELTTVLKIFCEG